MVERVFNMTIIKSHIWVQRALAISEKMIRMPLRDTLYRLTLSSPFALLAVLGFTSRLANDSFEPIGCTAQEEQDISAYIAPTKAVAQLTGYETRQQLLAVADIWFQGYADGRLRPLPSSSWDDTIRSPIKSQIKTANDGLVGRIVGFSRREAKQGEYDLAAEDAVIALRLAGPLKYSDCYAVALFGARERSILLDLQALAPKLSAAEKVRVKQAVSNLLKAQQPLDSLANTAADNFQQAEQTDSLRSTPNLDPADAYSENTGQVILASNKADKEILRSLNQEGKGRLHLRAVMLAVASERRSTNFETRLLKLLSSSPAPEKPSL